MNRASLVVLEIGIAVLAIAALIFMLRPRAPAPLVINAGGGWTVFVGSEASLSQVDRSEFNMHTDHDGAINLGKQIYIDSENPEFTVQHWAALGPYFAAVFSGAAAVDPGILEEGVIAHESVAHLSDHYFKGHPLKAIALIWSLPLPEGPVTNPWRVIDQTWPGHINPHLEMPNIPDAKYLSATVPW